MSFVEIVHYRTTYMSTQLGSWRELMRSFQNSLKWHPRFRSGLQLGHSKTWTAFSLSNEFVELAPYLEDVPLWHRKWLFWVVKVWIVVINIHHNKKKRSKEKVLLQVFFQGFWQQCCHRQCCISLMQKELCTLAKKLVLGPIGTGYLFIFQT